MKPTTRVLLFAAILIILAAAIWWWLTMRIQPPDVVTCTNNNLLPPEDCNPDWLAGVNFDNVRPLADLPASNCPNPLGVGQCTVRTYTGDNNQKFTITVEGQNIQDYLNTAKPYFIVQQVEPGVTPPPDLNLPSLAAILIDNFQVRDRTENPQQTLRDLRDSLVSDKIVEECYKEGKPVVLSVTLNDVVCVYGRGEFPLISLNQDAAIKQASDTYIKVGTAAGLTPQQIDKLTSTIPGEIAALMEEPGATFLDDPAAIPDYSTTLAKDPNAILITLDWATAPAEESANLWVVWFAIDPNIGSYGTHIYKEKCGAFSASAGLRATKGSMTDVFWRISPYFYIGSRTANVRNNPSPGGMSHSSRPDRRNYDTYVRGGPEGLNTYNLSGGWVRGSGCR